MEINQVKEIETTYSQDEANQLLESGWILLAVASGQEQTGANDYTPLFKYCLGRPA